ncbi:MAG: thiamine biosynthesis lipoprotein [Sphingobacteriales bacterium]|jgi:thiamine biosynthesis lipoprotein
MKYSVLLFAVVTLISCQPKSSSFEGNAQGTTYSVKIVGASDQGLKVKMDSLLTQIDFSLSTYNPNSIISKVNRNEVVQLDDHFKSVFEKSLLIAKSTNGAFDFTAKPLFDAYGFDEKKSMKVAKLNIDSVLEFVGYEKVRIDGDNLVKEDLRIQLNFNASAQGYSVDKMAEILENKGIENYFIELGGETKAKGKNKKGKLWRIGIDKPEEKLEKRQLAAILSLDNKALATSGNYRNFYVEGGVKYVHTINPITGKSELNNLLSVTILAESCHDADAYATALMVMGVDKAKHFSGLKNLEVFLIYTTEEGVETYTNGPFEVEMVD